jgi:hypothetical protein
VAERKPCTNRRVATHTCADQHDALWLQALHFLVQYSNHILKAAIITKTKKKPGADRLSRSSKLIEPKILDTTKGECNLISIAIGQEEPRTPDDCLCRINV